MDYDKKPGRTSKVKEALKRDLEQTKHDLNHKKGQELNQDAGDTLKQAAGKEPVPPPYLPNPDKK
ncbi:hypothetical protein CYFUS_009271 [Cystobacter fuscus]|uniref:Uncharacterized protein n=1 Tax=Cystobacter fuscus TaxID=43 RepID=A0A250JK67_9BACT|nr:hypothetical protein [Cystobacter fuscus]ATB43791.1 hypothetical protein CYFUS_009271 [Cystobacter fuscus]